MQEHITISEAKRQFSRLIDRVHAGEEIVICRRRCPVAMLVPYDAQPTPLRLGSLRGQVWIADDFDAPDEEIERLFGTRD